MDFETITPAKVAERLKRGEKLFLIDVREPQEHEVARIEAAQLLPLSRFEEWSRALLNPADEIIVLCHHGIRSAQVCAYLASQGFTKMVNVAGGIDAWSCEVDRNVPRY